jgi:nucleoside-triphosphatase THEP1
MMKLAYVSLPGRGATDAFLADVVAELEMQGRRLAGTVQSNLHRENRRHCDMDIRVLPDGPQVRISEDRGDLARGCRLDSGALEQTVQDVLERVEGADLLIVNKFGKREAEGRGLVPAIILALELGIPVLLGVNALNLPAFEDFAAGLATPLAASSQTVLPPKRCGRPSRAQLPQDGSSKVSWISGCFAANLGGRKTGSSSVPLL